MKSLKYNYNIDLFKTKDETFYYLLGAFITDGCVTETGSQKTAYRAALSSADVDWLKNIRDLICKDLPLKKIASSNCYVISIYSTEICNILIEEGCIPRKSMTVKFPSIPDKYLQDFLRGCMDGDGSISLPQYTKKKNNKIYTYIKISAYLCGASLDFFTFLDAKLTDLNFTHCMMIASKPGDIHIMKNGKEITRKNNVYRLTFGDSSAAKFLEWVYYPGHQLSMLRKRKLAEQATIINAIKIKKNPQLYNL